MLFDISCVIPQFFSKTKNTDTPISSIHMYIFATFLKNQLGRNIFYDHSRNLDKGRYTYNVVLHCLKPQQSPGKRKQGVGIIWDRIQKLPTNFYFKNPKWVTLILEDMAQQVADFPQKNCESSLPLFGIMLRAQLALYSLFSSHLLLYK